MTTSTSVHPSAYPTIPAVMRSMRTDTAIRLARYLLQRGGSDILTFETEDGAPDVRQALMAAELLRESMGCFCPDMFSVEVLVHKVRIVLEFRGSI